MKQNNMINDKTHMINDNKNSKKNNDIESNKNESIDNSIDNSIGNPIDNINSNYKPPNIFNYNPNTPPNSNIEYNNANNQNLLHINPKYDIYPNKKILETYKLANTIKLFAALTCIFTFLNMFMNIWFLTTILFAIIGYFGATKYNYNLTLLYFSYFVINNIVKFVYLIYITYNDEERSNISDNYISTFWFIFIINLLVNCWMLKIIYKFLINLKNLSLLDMSELKNDYIIIVEKKYILW